MAHLKILKFILPLFILTSSMNAYSQNEWEIKLSTNSKSEFMGVWEQGDYKIYVELNQMKTFFNQTSQTYNNDISRCSEKDSSLVKYYTPSAKRYQDAANRLAQANTDFDLRTLIVYNGTEDANQNIGNSSIVRDYIKQLVEGGSAIVVYKGEQIYTLHCKSEFKEQGEILFSGYLIRTYFDDIDNSLFSEFSAMGW